MPTVVRQDVSEQEEFWTEVKEERLKLGVSLQKEELEGQPEYSDARVFQRGNRLTDNNLVFITSVRNRAAGTLPGSVVLTTVQLAGQKIVEQTHVPSTADEISQLRGEQEDRREAIQREIIEKKTQYTSDQAAALQVARRDLADKQK